MLSLLEIMDHYGIEMDDSSASGETLFLCPFHDDQAFGSAFFNDDDVWYCFSCGFGGNATQFVAKKEGIDNREAFILLKNDFQDQINKDYNKALEKCTFDVDLKTKHTLLDYKKLCDAFEKLVLKALLSHRASIDQYADWISICSWAFIVDRQIVDAKYGMLLNIYSEFSSQF